MPTYLLFSNQSKNLLFIKTKLKVIKSKWKWYSAWSDKPYPDVDNPQDSSEPPSPSSNPNSYASSDLPPPKSYHLPMASFWNDWTLFQISHLFIWVFEVLGTFCCNFCLFFSVAVIGWHRMTCILNFSSMGFWPFTTQLSYLKFGYYSETAIFVSLRVLKLSGQGWHPGLLCVI